MNTRNAYLLLGAMMLGAGVASGITTMVIAPRDVDDFTPQMNRLAQDVERLGPTSSAQDVMVSLTTSAAIIDGAHRRLADSARTGNAMLIVAGLTIVAGAGCLLLASRSHRLETA